MLMGKLYEITYSDETITYEERGFYGDGRKLNLMHNEMYEST
jgi:hypothetical protein